MPLTYLMAKHQIQYQVFFKYSFNNFQLYWNYHNHLQCFNYFMAKNQINFIVKIFLLLFPIILIFIFIIIFLFYSFGHLLDDNFHLLFFMIILILIIFFVIFILCFIVFFLFLIFLILFDIEDLLFRYFFEEILKLGIN